MVSNIFTDTLSGRKIVICCFMFLWAGCFSCSDQDKVSAPYKAYVMYLDKSKSTLGTPYYSLGAKELTDLKDISKLDGTYFSIREGGTLEVDTSGGAFISAEKFEKGSTPNIRYKTKDGVIIPKDYSSLIMLSVFYQFQEIFGNLEEYTGVLPKDIVSTADNGRMSIWYEPVVTDKHENESSSSSEIAKLNAAYLQGNKQFVLFQRSSLERVPISANLSVLAHEFGHALFEYSFYGNKYDHNRDEDFEIDPIFGMNEGLADYVSFIYTGVSNILGSSFLFAEDYMQRDFAQTTFTYDSMKMKAIKGSKDNTELLKNYCNGGYYCFGTLFARSLWEASKTSGYEGEKGYEYLKKVLSSLAKARDVLTPMVSEFTDKIETENSGTQEIVNTPKVLSLFLYALLINLDESLKDNLCSSLVKNFGSVMNKADHSGVCPHVTFSVNRVNLYDVYEDF